MNDHDELCDCITCEPPVKAIPGRKYTNSAGTWTVIGFDGSGQGAVLRGQIGQIRTEPIDEHGAIRNNRMKPVV